MCLFAFESLIITTVHCCFFIVTGPALERNCGIGKSRTFRVKSWPGRAYWESLATVYDRAGAVYTRWGAPLFNCCHHSPGSRCITHEYSINKARKCHCQGRSWVMRSSLLIQIRNWLTATFTISHGHWRLILLMVCRIKGQLLWVKVCD